MTQQERFKQAVSDAVDALGTNAFAVEKANGLPADAIRGVLRKKTGSKKEAGTSLNRAKEICDALGLELYIGPPRTFPPSPEVEVDGNLFDTVPRYNAQAAGGHGALNLDAEPIDRLAFTRNWLKCQGINAAHCALITAKGDSMEPRIFEGDLIMIDRRKTTIRNHRVYVFNDGDRGTRVKRLEHIPDMGIFLHSDNREDYPPESRIGHAANEIKVLGEVVWSGHKWA